MVAIADLARVSELYREHTELGMAVDNLDNGGPIISMTINGGPLGEVPPPDLNPRMPVIVSTAGWQYPAAMLDAIRAQIAARQTAILQELAGLGITALPPQPARRHRPVPG